MRKAFKFYRSYFDIARELEDKDRLAFYDALLTRQFEGIELELNGLAKFAYISQKHSIDAQIKGYEDKVKEPIQAPTQGVTQGPTVEPTQQEKEKVKEKVKEKEKENSIEDRKLKFADTLRPFLEEFGSNMLNDFYSYWTEPTQSKIPKLKYELMKTWDTYKRLKTWKKNDEKFNPKQQTDKTKWAWE